MSLITTIIPQQNFEIIRERIAAILKDEIANQVLLTYDTSIDADVLIENMNPNDMEDLPLINVSFASGNYDNKNYGGSVRGNPYIYNIDVYANGEENNLPGDYNANILLQRIIGICRYILDNPIYRTLGFASPLIERVYVQDINIANNNKKDAKNNCMGRLTFAVIVVETAQLITPKLIEGYATTVTINGTQKGYYWDPITGDWILEDFNDDFNI